MAGILATETVLTRRNKGTSINGLDMAICKVCGEAEETNLHMLCECTGQIDLITERKVWISKMRTVIKTTLSKYMSKEQLKVFLELWSLDGNGKLSGWITDERLNLEAATNDPMLLKLKVLIDQQKGVDNHMYGITTTGWRDILEDSLSLSPESALAFQVALHKETQVGIQSMWQARNVVRHAMISLVLAWEIRTF